MKVMNNYRGNRLFIGPKPLLLVMIFIAQLFELSYQTCGLIPLPTDTTSIAVNAYNGCTSLLSLTVSSTVTFIG